MSLRRTNPVAYQALLQTLMRRVSGAPWPHIAEVVSGFYAGLLELSRSQPKGTVIAERDLPQFLADMLEQIGAPPITTPDQAFIYTMSAKEEHRTAGEEWLSDHPDEADAINQQIKGIRWH